MRQRQLRPAESSFEIWFRENKESLRDDYENYLHEMKNIEEKPLGFKNWAREALAGGLK